MSTWTAADLPSFSGRTVIVTGANSGLGEVTARELARAGAREKREDRRPIGQNASREEGRDLLTSCMPGGGLATPRPSNWMSSAGLVGLR